MLIAMAYILQHESDNLQYHMVGQWIDGTIVPLSHGPILIDWE